MAAVLDYSRVRTVGPAVEPITLQEAKSHLRVVGNNDNSYIESLIAAAREDLELQTRLAFVTQTWQTKLNAWPSIIELTPAPLISVSAIAYLDSAGDSQTLATSVYDVDTARRPGVVWLKYSQSWPVIRGIQNAITITYTAGYGSDGTDTPMMAKQAMLMNIENMFVNRGMDGNSLLMGLAGAPYQSLVRGLSYGQYP